MLRYTTSRDHNKRAQAGFQYPLGKNVVSHHIHLKSNTHSDTITPHFVVIMNTDPVEPWRVGLKVAEFKDRIRAYRKDMGLTQVQMGEILGVDRSTYTHYERGVAPKTLALCVEYASRLGVTMDWLTGYADGPKWGPVVRDFRIYLKRHQQQLGRIGTVIDRFRAILELASHFALPISRDWFMAGILGVSVDGFRAFLVRESQTLGPQSLERLSEFTGVPEMWLMEGDMEADLMPVDLLLQEYEPALVQFVERKLSVDDVLDGIDQLSRYINAKRALGQ